MNTCRCGFLLGLVISIQTTIVVLYPLNILQSPRFVDLSKKAQSWSTIVCNSANPGQEDVIVFADEAAERVGNLRPSSAAILTAHNVSTVFEGVTARAFKPIERSIPCFPAEENWPKLQREYTDKGFVFVKPYKTGSSTASGVNLRLARSAAKRLNKGVNMCLARSDHAWAAYSYSNLNQNDSVLWTIIRDPSTRAVSQFFHFEVSREKKEPSDKEFESFMYERLLDDYYLSQLSLSQYEYGKHDPVAYANSILARYDFVGLTERMDESLVVLAMILKVPISDVLYLASKGHGGFDDGGGRSSVICTYIWPSFVSRGMQKILDSEKWEKKTHWDRVLFNAVNRSLDLTIDSLGRERVERTVAAYQAALQKSRDVCLPQTRFPCSAGGDIVPRNETDCLWSDSGCGSECLDQIAKDLKLDLLY